MEIVGSFFLLAPFSPARVSSCERVTLPSNLLPMRYCVMPAIGARSCPLETLFGFFHYQLYR